MKLNKTIGKSLKMGDRLLGRHSQQQSWARRRTALMNRNTESTGSNESLHLWGKTTHQFDLNTSPSSLKGRHAQPRGK